MKQRVTVKLIPRIDMQAIANKMVLLSHIHTCAFFITYKNMFSGL